LRLLQAIAQTREIVGYAPVDDAFAILGRPRPGEIGR